VRGERRQRGWRRLQLPDGEEPPRITSPAEAAQRLMPTMATFDQEELCVLLLDTRNQVIGVRAI
jgi:DNA repair protein RadC